MVLGEQYSALATGLLNQFPIVRTLHYFAYGQDIVPLCPQRTHNRKVAALVGQKAQCCGIHAGAATTMVSWAIVSAA